MSPIMQYNKRSLNPKCYRIFAFLLFQDHTDQTSLGFSLPWIGLSSQLSSSLHGQHLSSSSSKSTPFMGFPLTFSASTLYGLLLLNLYYLIHLALPKNDGGLFLFLQHLTVLTIQGNIVVLNISWLFIPKGYQVWKRL